MLFVIFLLTNCKALLDPRKLWMQVTEHDLLRMMEAGSLKCINYNIFFQVEESLNNTFLKILKLNQTT